MNVVFSVHESDRESVYIRVPASKRARGYEYDRVCGDEKESICGFKRENHASGRRGRWRARGGKEPGRVKIDGMKINRGWR